MLTLGWLKASDFVIPSEPKILRLVNFRAGEDAETVVCALFHDVGELLSPVCHGEIGEPGNMMSANS